ncbi:zinc transporter ZntB [Limnobaculum parvum]|uniref:Zinc transporter ZntB n=1 Tax=Limnobaculum parvum TaxID=2172103 RepID=A0A2Y9TUG4_9GAMM|nr:zinc transporter ZntB [Limnobaculum parvum]AWH87272.1 zinc transporter ZntB [Limnobaculum parvum]
MNKVSGNQLEVPQEIHAYQLDGKGGILPVTDKTEATAAEPCWIHIDYEQPESLHWLNETPLLPESFKEALSGESCRPRVTRQGNGTLIILRSINLNSESVPDPLVTLRVFISDSLIISSRHRAIHAVDEVVNELKKGTGPFHSGSWLVEILDFLTDQVSDFIDDLHGRVIDLEDGLLEKEVPERGVIALIRKQLIVLRRHLMPQRDVFSRLASERLPWMSNEDRHRMQDIADRLGRGLDDLDATIARTAVVVDEINSLLADAMNRRTYTMSLMAMLFLPATFLTGLFGVNLGGIPGGDKEHAFTIFCICLVVVGGSILWWLKKSKWL